MQCFKLAMEERCALGIILKNDSVWCEAKQNIDAILGQKISPVCHSLLHHEKCTRTPDADHYTYIKKKRTVKVLQTILTKDVEAFCETYLNGR